VQSAVLRSHVVCPSDSVCLSSLVSFSFGTRTRPIHLHLSPWHS